MEQKVILDGDSIAREIVTEVRREEALLKAGALQNAIFNGANFSSIATDAKGVIQIFNVGAERMLGYTVVEMVNKITPADISDPQEVIARGEALSFELGTPITPAFEALVFKASRMESQHGKDLGEIIKAAHSASGLTKQLLATPNNPPRIRRKSIPAARSSRSPSWPRSSFVRCGKHWIDEARCPSPRPDRSPRRCHLVRDRISRVRMPA